MLLSLRCRAKRGAPSLRSSIALKATKADASQCQLRTKDKHVVTRRAPFRTTTIVAPPIFRHSNGRPKQTSNTKVIQRTCKRGFRASRQPRTAGTTSATCSFSLARRRARVQCVEICAWLRHGKFVYIWRPSVKAFCSLATLLMLSRNHGRIG